MGSSPDRILDTSTFTGDTWAVRATQTAPPVDIPVFEALAAGPFRVSITPTDSNGVQVVDTAAVFDYRLVRVFEDEFGRTKTMLLESEAEAASLITGGGGGMTETDVDAYDRIAVAFPTFVAGSAAFFEIRVTNPIVRII